MPFGADQAAVDRVTAQLAGVGRLGVAYSGGVDSATLLALAVRALGPAPGARRPRGLPEPGRRRAGGGARRRPLRRRPGGRGRHPRGGAGRPTAPTARTAASTARTSCSPASTTRSSRAARARRGRVRGERRRRAASGPPGRPGGHRARRAAPAGRRRVWTRPRCGGSRAVLALPCADKPAAPCLASRIPHFEPVTPEKLAQVEAAEAGLRGLGFRDCRVRHHGDVGAGRAAAPTTSRGPPRDRCGSRSTRPCGRPGSGSSRSTWPGSSRARSRSRWWPPPRG